MTLVSITQSLSALHVEHAYLLEEHGAGHAALRQREAELADVQTREVDACATADALLQATRAAEDRATRAERIAALADREVRFLKALNVRLPLDYSLSLSPLGSRFICHEQTS
jgi:mitotic spindle assembly checkpoint protein MAD1